MKAQFFIISSVIMIYVIVLTFQYLTGFSDIRLSGVEEHQELSYIKNIKGSLIQTFNVSNYSSNGDLNKVAKDIDFAKNFFKQELLKKGINFDSKFIFFSNGFESNDLIDWTSVYGTPQLVNHTAYDGVKSLYSNAIEYVTKNLSGVSEVYVRTYVNFNTLPSNSNKYYFMDLYENSNQILGLGLWNNNGIYKLIVYSSFSGPWVSSGISIGNGEWHYFELYWLENGTNSILKTWYDEQLEIVSQAIASGGKGKLINQYNFGGANAVGGTPDLYVDCVAIGSDYVGDKCYPDEQNYFDFTLKTNGMYTETEFPYEEEIIPQFFNVNLWLKFNEASGTRAFDSSSYGNNGTYYGETFNDGTSYSGSTPTDLHTTSGIYGSALSFDGSNDYVDLGSNKFDYSNITVCAWIKTSELVGDGIDQRIVATGSENTVLNWTLTVTFDRYICMSNRTTFHDTARTNSLVNDDIWHYACGTTNPEKVYLDGVLQTSSKSDSWSFEPSAKIGSRGTAQYFNGSIDEVRIWNRTLTLAEINNEMSSSLPVVRPLASWSFEELVSATYVNDTHIWVNGTYGSALSFDGANDWVNASDSSSLDVSNITIAAWIYPLGFGGGNLGRIVDKSSAYMFYVYNISNEEFLYFYYQNSTGSWDQSGSTSHSVKLNTWQHVAVTYDGTYVRFYLNGVLNSTHTTAALGPIKASSSNLYIGYNSTIYDANTRAFNGTIDELRIWNRTLSQADINAEMNKG